MPKKAAYKTFETDPETTFEFRLARDLHMTVGRLRAEMSNDEFVRWALYYAREAQQEELEQGGGAT